MPAYQSTRGGRLYTFEEAILEGWAENGGFERQSNRTHN